MARQFQWLSADGQQLITLTDAASGYRVLADGTSGLTAPSYRITTSTYAGVDGVDLQAVSADARDLVLGMLIQGEEELLEQRVAALVRAMRPKAGPGTLIVTSPSGRVRSLRCTYSSGLEGMESRGTKLPGRWWKFAPHFLATDPWWLGDEQTMSVGLGAPTPFFPFFPMVLSSSTVQGQFTVDLSDSDTPAFPVWTITGPGSSLTLSNETTNRQLTVGASLASGEVMVVDTRPDYLSIRRGDGTNLLPAVDGYPDLWPLVEDVNQVTAALSGATSNSRIEGSYQPRYSGI